MICFRGGLKRMEKKKDKKGDGEFKGLREKMKRKKKMEKNNYEGNRERMKKRLRDEKEDIEDYELMEIIMLREIRREEKKNIEKEIIKSLG